MTNRLAGSRGFTLIELLIVVAIIGTLAAMAMAGYKMAHIRAAETSAIASLQAINQAQTLFSQTCGNQKYAPSLTALGIPPDTTNAAFLSPDLTVADTIVKSGYRLTMGGTAVSDPVTTCTGVVPVENYQVTADPLNPGIGGRYYATNADRVIFVDDATFFGNMPETGAPGHGAEIR